MLRGVHEGEGRSAADIARVLGQHVTTTRFHLDLMVEAGLATSWSETRASVGRPRKLYAVGPRGSSTEDSRSSWHALAALLARAWPGAHGAVLAERAGYDWARAFVRELPPEGADPQERLHQDVVAMAEVLSEWGYLPVVSPTPGGVDIEIRDCPFRALAQEQTDVVCAVHRGLMRGSLERLGSPAYVELIPFFEPERCRASLRPRTGQEHD